MSTRVVERLAHQGRLREARGHRHAGLLPADERERHGWTIAAIVAAVVSTAVSTYATYQSAQQQQETAHYNRKVAENQAEMAKNAGLAQASAIAETRRREIAANVAGIGASGVTPEGSPLLVLMDNAQQADYEQQQAKYRGLVGQTGYQSQADLLRWQAGQISPMTSAGRTLLTGASDTFAAGARYYNKPQPPPVPSSVVYMQQGQ